MQRCYAWDGIRKYIVKNVMMQNTERGEKMIKRLVEITQCYVCPHQKRIEEYAFPKWCQLDEVNE